MMVLPRNVGDFSSDRDWSTDNLIKIVEDKITNLDVKSFLFDLENLSTFEDDIVLVYYDYLNNNIGGSTYIYLYVGEDEEGQFFEYGIVSELDGNREFSDTIPLGKEEVVLDTLYDTLISNTEYFRNKLY